MRSSEYRLFRLHYGQEVGHEHASMLVKAAQLGPRRWHWQRRSGRLAPWARADPLHRGSFGPPSQPSPTGHGIVGGTAPTGVLLRSARLKAV
eukprot:3523322-Alexandrium_andersonii.AAC.1